MRFGRRQEVKGAGVVGKQPVLKPGESFEYTSGVPLPTPSGFMTGSYGMASVDGEAVRDRDSDLFARQPGFGANDQLILGSATSAGSNM